MIVSAIFVRSGIFAEGRFLGKILDEWIVDLQEFVHRKLPHILVVLLIAVLLTRLISIGARQISSASDRKDPSAGRHSQVKTFTAIFRTTLNGILWALTFIQILTVIGFNLGPLLASAGVAGVAIGLAAQTIVKDVLNGMLIVMEDQFNVGETVRLAGMTGTVEAMTLRRTEVRDGDGTLYIVPNSQITTVANLSRDFNVATVNVSVDFSAEPDKVTALLTSIAMGIRNDAQFSPLFLKDPEILGVDAIKGSEMVYPVVFKTLPTKQYTVIREFRRRVRLALEEHGMLPGDPYRTFREFESSREPESSSEAGSNANEQTGDDHGQKAAMEKKEKPPIDATAIPTTERNPFMGE
jgi:moderate conductance mechanosensitive channel